MAKLDMIGIQIHWQRMDDYDFVFSNNRLWQQPDVTEINTIYATKSRILTLATTFSNFLGSNWEKMDIGNNRIWQGLILCRFKRENIDIGNTRI